MKKAFRFIIVFLFFSASKLIAQIPEIITKTDYTVAGSETLIASQRIILKPNTWIKSGSTFVAKISPDAYIPFTFSNENYIFSRLFQRAFTNSSSIANNADVIESIVYYDGLGRPMQDIAIKASPSKKDIVTHISYDNFGRSEKEYLPYMDTSSSYATYRSSAEINTSDYYKSNYSTDINTLTPNPFSQKEFERSPLNRVLKQAAPGKDWAIGLGHEIKLDYLFNSSIDGVKLYTVTTQLSADGVYEPSVASYSIYGENELYKTVTKNENWVSGKNNTTEEFKDKLGRIILKRTYANYGNPNQLEVKHDTYYVYDTYSNLTYVLPPKADGVVTDAVLKDICYQYKYDRRNRLVEKKLPGKDWEYIIYDKLDRPVLTQDANLKALNKWIFTKYDAFGRISYTGEYTNTSQTTRAAVQTLANGSTVLFENKQASALDINGTSINYSNDSFPNSAIDLFTINYYDNYSDVDLDGGTFTPINNAKGLATCSKIRILGTNNWTTYVNYYDAEGRPIYNYSKNNYLAVTETVKTQFDFGGKILETISTHKKGNDALITIIDVYSYDHVGRLLTQKQTINNQAQEMIVSNTYNNLGQLTNKEVGGKTTQARLQNIDYTYNIRGWLKSINNINAIGNDLFAFNINYNTPTLGSALFNGNISQTFWKTANSDSSLKNYTYTYDDLNRLTKSTDNSSINPGRYNEGVSYDKNGNIMSILRLGNTNVAATSFGTMDNLAYTYDAGNKLIKVEDTSGSTEGFTNGSNVTNEYTYDNNGNMKTDSNKGITTINYNYLNLPVSITMNGGTINYVYDAAGVKQRKTISSGGSTEYANDFIYENNILKQFSQPEGYVIYNTGVFYYIYQFKDHLGNNRLSYQDKDNNGVVNNTEIIQENNYYTFGLAQKGYNGTINGVDNRYKYNGKEFQDENIGGQQLNFYDYGARNYDPALGRWMNIDPLIELMRDNSTYSFAFNNPIFFDDYDGLIPIPQIVKATRISSGFGLRMHPRKHKLLGHAGIDLAADTGNIVKSAAIGTIAKIGWDPDGYGNYIVVKHIQGYYTLYAHLSEIGKGIKVGGSVGNGESIGSSGNTGGSTGPHLHFEIINAQSLQGVFNKSNKIDPESIYDLNEKLYPNAFNYSFDNPSFNFSIIENLKIPTVSIPQFTSSPKSSSQTKVKSVNSITPSSITPTTPTSSIKANATVMPSKSNLTPNPSNSTSNSNSVRNFRKSPLL